MEVAEMLEADISDAGDASPDVVDHDAATSGSDSASGRGPSPPLAAFLGHGEPAASVQPSVEEDAVLRSSDWPTTTTHNNNCIRYPPTKPEVGLESARSGSRKADVTTALAGVHAVLDRIDGVAERQQVVGDVIVQLQVLRCRLQLAQVDQSSIIFSSTLHRY